MSVQDKSVNEIVRALFARRDPVLDAAGPPVTRAQRFMDLLNDNGWALVRIDKVVALQD